MTPPNGDRLRFLTLNLFAFQHADGAARHRLVEAECRRVLDRPVAGVWASDHFGVYAELRRPPHPPGEDA